MIEGLFPNLKSGGYKKTSEKSDRYNCIAWAAGNNRSWWWPDKLDFGYWPDGAPRANTVDACIKAFESIGYVICADGTPEHDFEKVAIYKKSNKLTHAARQLENGKWSSKLGEDIDISHEIDGLDGGYYGDVCVLMKRDEKNSS